MATDNKQVTAYLPEHLIEYLTEYCTYYGIKRKKDDKPLLGTAIVDLLNIVAKIPVNELVNLSDNPNHNSIKDRPVKLSELSELVNSLLDEKLKSLTSVILTKFMT